MEPPFFGAKNPSFDSYASDKDTSLLRYLRSLSPSPGGFNTLAKPSQMNPRGFSHGASPLSTIENTASPMMRSSYIYGTPLKLEEDVIVMDGIPAGGKMKSFGASDSGSLSAISSFGYNLYKTDICRVWEETGICPYNSKCQFAHGKEELRPAAPNKVPSELSYIIPDDSSSTIGRRHQIRRPQQYEQPLSRRIPLSCPLSSGESEFSTIIDAQPPPSSKITSTIYSDWLPEDDGILAIDQSNVGDIAKNLESRERTNKFINNVLYGDSSARRKNRLPVFTQLKLDD